MSRLWFYTLFIQKQKFLSEEKFNSIIETAGAVGFAVKNPVTGLISYLTTDGTESMEFDNLAEARKVIGESGGALQLWKNSIDIDLIFDHSGVGQARMIKSLSLNDDPHFGSISIGIDSTQFKESLDPDNLDADLKKLFVGLCVSLSAVYGYSIDETLFERLLPNWHPHRDVKKQKLPSVLCWLNYFTENYIKKIGVEKFQKFDGQITEIKGEGVIVSLFENPRAVQIPVMLKINQKWWKVCPKNSQEALLPR